MANRIGIAALLLVLVAAAPDHGFSEQATNTHALEIRTYTLKPGTRERFHERFEREALPLLRRWKIDVVAYGPSLHDRDSYFLMRAFSSPADRERLEDAFYASAEWRDGPRAAVLADIEEYTTVVISINGATLEGLRRPANAGIRRSAEENAMQADTSATTETDVILSLNRDYIEAVKRSDARWFDRMLAVDFRCSLPDGSIIGRERFLERAARPLDISDLEVHDVEVRVMGDAAIVHARTTFSTVDGRPGSGRYTDVWHRQNGRWLAVSAHFTRRVE